MAAPTNAQPPVGRSERRRAWFRVLLGNAQMFFAVVSIVLAVLTGLNAVTIVFVAGTCSLTVTSLFIFRGWPWWKGRSVRW